MPAFKRLIILSDGTWQTLENDTPTNILKLALGLRREDDDGVQQVVMYDAGVGTENGVDRVLGGAFGAGIDKNIKDLYTFLAMNYDDGDEIYLFGFSRGAYTVRSLGGLISISGLVRRKSIQFVKEAYDLYRKKPGIDSIEAKEFRATHGNTVPITLLACFDTVGSLGIPVDNIFTHLFNSKYQFHTTTIGANVKNAVHMVSIDEDRSAFKPTLMTPHPDIGDSHVTQQYFWGGHGGVGGGDSRQIDCSKVTLAFLFNEIEKRGLGLAFDVSTIPETPDVTRPGEKLEQSPIMTFVTFLTGKYVRLIKSRQDLHQTAIVRYKNCESWRPSSLIPIQKDLLEDDS